MDYSGLSQRRIKFKIETIALVSTSLAIVAHRSDRANSSNDYSG